MPFLWIDKRPDPQIIEDADKLMTYAATLEDANAMKERGSDMPELAAYIAAKAAHEQGEGSAGIAEEFMDSSPRGAELRALRRDRDDKAYRLQFACAGRGLDFFAVLGSYKGQESALHSLGAVRRGIAVSKAGLSANVSAAAGIDDLRALRDG